MSGTTENERPPANDIDDHGQALLRAARLSVQAALWRHKQLGNPICVWQDGRVVWIPPEEIPVDGPPDDGLPLGAIDDVDG